MKQEMEGREFREDYQKAEGEKPLCPHCKKPMETGPQYLSNYWQWNDKTKRYERDEPDPRTEELFCSACRAEYLESLYR